jgi:dTDP-4-dehydrorhamnose 3,5-epimerase
MRVIEADIPDVLIIEPKIFHDERGFFLESYQVDRYHKAGITDNFLQHNHSRSCKNVLRGLHYQINNPQSKLLTVMRGKIFDVCVDLRKNSNYFGQSFGITLGEDMPWQLYIPAGFAHGFCVLDDFADIHYQIGAVYDPLDEAGILWSDPSLNIQWPIASPIVCKRDSLFPLLINTPPENLPRI